MNIPRFLITGIVASAFIFGFEMVWHGQLMMEMYEETKQLWRTDVEMKAMFQWMIGAQVALGFILTYIYTLNAQNKGLGEGFRFGIPVGLLLGASMFGAYAYMPISLDLALMWLAAGFLVGLGVGIICSLLYKS